MTPSTCLVADGCCRCYCGGGFYLLLPCWLLVLRWCACFMRRLQLMLCGLQWFALYENPGSGGSEGQCWKDGFWIRTGFGYGYGSGGAQRMDFGYECAERIVFEIIRHCAQHQNFIERLSGSNETTPRTSLCDAFTPPLWWVRYSRALAHPRYWGQKFGLLSSFCGTRDAKALAVVVWSYQLLW